MSKNKELHGIEEKDEKYDLYRAWEKEVGKWSERFSDVGSKVVAGLAACLEMNLQ